MFPNNSNWWQHAVYKTIGGLCFGNLQIFVILCENLPESLLFEEQSWLNLDRNVNVWSFSGVHLWQKADLKRR